MHEVPERGGRTQDVWVLYFRGLWEVHSCFVCTTRIVTKFSALQRVVCPCQKDAASLCSFIIVVMLLVCVDGKR